MAKKQQAEPVDITSTQPSPAAVTITEPKQKAFTVSVPESYHPTKRIEADTADEAVRKYKAELGIVTLPRSAEVVES